MSSTSHGSIWTALCALALGACGGGGGGSAPPPAPDTVAPDTTLASTPTARTNLVTLPFSVTSNEAGVTFEARADTGAFTIVPATFALSGFDEGPHSVQVRARDAAGNIDASPATFDFVVDRTPPDTTLVSGPAAGPVAASSATLTFTSENNASFQASVDGGAFAQAASPLTVTGLGSGTHTVSVRAMDQAGNVDPSPVTSTWTIDVSAPVASIVFPTRHAYTEASTLRVRGTATDAVVISALSVNGIVATTSDGYAHWTAAVPIADGDNALDVSATDALGNTTASAARVDVANRGLMVSTYKNLIRDAVRNRFLGTDAGRGAIVAIDPATGRTSLVSDRTRGTGPVLDGSDFFIFMDTVNDRILAVRNNTLLRVDPVTGNRTAIATAPTTPDTDFSGNAVTSNADGSRVYLASYADQMQGFGIYSIDTQTGARTLITGGSAGAGSGSSLLSVADLAYDAANARLIVLDDSRRALHAIDLTTGARTLITSHTPAVANGVTLELPIGIALDTANNRALIVDKIPPSFDSTRIVAVNLATGERATIVTNPVDSELGNGMRALLDTAGSRLLITTDFGKIAQVSLASGDVRRFSDSIVATGNSISGNGSLILEPSNASLLATGRGGIVRIDLATGVRTLALATVVGYVPAHLNIDSRPGTPPNRLIGLGPGNALNPMVLRSYDLTTGTDTVLTGTTMPYSSTFYPFDGPNARFIAAVINGGMSTIVAVSAVTGAEGPTLADPAIGPVPFGGVSAIGLDDPPGATRRILGLSTPLLFAVDSAGVRSEVSSPGTGTGIPLLQGDALLVDSAARRAYVAGGNDHALQSIDLVTGNRSLLSGENPADHTVTGSGPPITPYNVALAADFPRGLLYALSGVNTLLTIDLTTGDRVITSR